MVSRNETAGGPPAADPAPAGVLRLLTGWHVAEKRLAMVAYVVIAALLVVDVLARELLGPVGRALGFGDLPAGLFGAQKLALWAMVFGSFLGLGIATASGAHLLPRVGFGWVPAAFGPAVDRLADLLTGVVLCGAAWYAYRFVGATAESGMLTAVFELPLWWLQVVVPLGFLSAGLRYFFFARWPAARPARPEFQE